MAANPNNLNYFLRGGSVLPTYAMGNVDGTANMKYWRQGGGVAFQAAILPWFNPETYTGYLNYGQAVNRSNTY